MAVPLSAFHVSARLGADWVIAEANFRSLTVVTYQGRSFSGAPTLKANTKTPGICQAVGVGCITLPEALRALGGSFQNDDPDDMTFG